MSCFPVEGLLLLTSLLFLATVNSTLIEDEITSFRLTNETIPLHYSLDIITRIHEDQFDFNGTVRIEILVINSTNKIVIHSKDLVILGISLVDMDSNVQLDNMVYKLLNENNMMVVYSPSNDVLVDDEEFLLKDGKRYSLIIEYSGQLNNVYNNRTFGFYATSYKNAANKTV